MNEILQKYLRAFKKLNIDRTHGIAPHKPILLISVLQAYQNEIISSNRIYLSAELIALFKTNWSLLVVTKHDCRISYPFYYLKSDKFWKLIPKIGFENVEQMGSIMKTFSNLNAAVEFALIEDDLLQLMLDKKSNFILQQYLLDEYFAATKSNFSNTLAGQQKLFEDIESKILNEPSEFYKQEIETLVKQKNEEELFLRGSLFKREIPKIYNNTCCISGMRIDSIISISMIDACHIVPFSLSYDDTITNGIALCPNLHRAFDRGLIAIDENYKVIISDKFKEDSSNYSIRAFENKKINLPKIIQHYPLEKNFEWHKREVFKG